MKSFSDLWQGAAPVLLDGATGTLLMAQGMPTGECPEGWAAANTAVVARMHGAYVDAGAQLVYAFTFGANEHRLAEYGLEKEMEAINTALVHAAKQGAQGRALVGGDISPLGQLIAPMGELTFEQTKHVYANQAAALARAGVDFFVIETMMDINQARAALLACRSVCDLPVMVSMTFEQGGRTLTGTDASTAALTLASLGADVIGCNCSTGPQEMQALVKAMAAISPVPVVAKPNAGLPTGALLSPADFAQQAAALVDCGAHGVGGCCGTTPEHIRLLGEAVAGKRLETPRPCKLPRALSGRDGMVLLGHEVPLCAIGERLNPTGKPALAAALQQGDDEAVVGIALEQVRHGAQVLDINVGAVGIDQRQTLPHITALVSARTGMPLCLDTLDIDALECALQVYEGRALINSISAETGRAQAILPLMRTYGAMAVLLPLGDGGVPKTAEQRIALIERLLEQAQGHDIGRERFVVDALALAIASERDGGQQALAVLDWCKRNDLITVMGVSNISFGLPQRAALNAAFLVAAQARGLTAAIVNVCEPSMHQALLGAQALIGGGEAVDAYAQSFAPKAQQQEGLAGAVLGGERQRAATLARAALEQGVPPLALIDQTMQGLGALGDAFANKTTFLPQLMAGAEAAKAAFALIQQALKTDQQAPQATAVVATVKGDIHDIGKNIVALMLENHGFRVIDLGKDVSNEAMMAAAQEYQADVVLQSALLTTTMEQMRAFARMNQTQPTPYLHMVGGAVVTQGFAQEIGAHYAADAVACARLAQQLVGLKRD